MSLLQRIEGEDIICFGSFLIAIIGNTLSKYGKKYHSALTKHVSTCHLFNNKHVTINITSVL